MNTSLTSPGRLYPKAILPVPNPKPTCDQLVAQMDHAAESVASRLAQGRIANVALESVVFMSPIRVGAAGVFLHPVAGYRFFVHSH